MLGSLDVLGNPGSMVADIQGGVRTFFREPRRGALRSPKAFGRGLVRGVAGLTGGVGGGLVGGFSNGLSAVSPIRPRHGNITCTQRRDHVKIVCGLHPSSVCIPHPSLTRGRW